MFVITELECIVIQKWIYKLCVNITLSFSLSVRLSESSCCKSCCSNNWFVKRSNRTAWNLFSRHISHSFATESIQTVVPCYVTSSSAELVATSYFWMRFPHCCAFLKSRTKINSFKMHAKNGICKSGLYQEVGRDKFFKSTERARFLKKKSTSNEDDEIHIWINKWWSLIRIHRQRQCAKRETCLPK